MRRCGAILIVVAGVTAHTARAEPEATPAASVDFAAPAGCPRGDAFAAELVTRAPAARIVAPSPRTRALVVRITSHGATYAGRLTVREPDGAETERAVTGDSCASVVTALAVIAAVAVDPTGQAASPPPEPPQEAPPPPPPAPAPPSPPSPSKPTPAAPPASETPAPAEATQGTAWDLALGLHGGLVSGVASTSLVVVPLFVDLANDGPETFAPSARLRIERTGSGSVAGTPRTQFTWTAASLDLCPIRFARGAFSARPCARLEAGSLEVTAIDVRPSTTGVRPWLSAGPLLRARAVLSEPLFAELEGAMNVAAVRDRFYTEPGGTAFRAPPVGLTATAGLGIVFSR